MPRLTSAAHGDQLYGELTGRDPARWTLDNYVYLGHARAGMGIVFETPLLIFSWPPVAVMPNLRQPAKGRKAPQGTAVVAAVVTPTPDPVVMMIDAAVPVV